MAKRCVQRLVPVGQKRGRKEVRVRAYKRTRATRRCS